MKGRSVVGSLAGVMKGRNLSMDIKSSLRNSILLPTLTYGSKNWTWNGAQQSRVRAVETSYPRGACGVSRWDGLSNEMCGMTGLGCVVVEWVKRSTLRWFGHIERMGNEEFVKMVYLSSAEGTNRRERPLGRWEYKVKEYVSERRVRENGARRECMDRERWRSICCGDPLGRRFWREWGVGAIDWFIAPTWELPMPWPRIVDNHPWAVRTTMHHPGPQHNNGVTMAHVPSIITGHVPQVGLYR